MEELRITPARSESWRRLRALSYLFIGGALLGLVAITFFPLPTGTNLLGTRLTAGLSLALGAALFLGARRLPTWVIPFVLALGTCIVTLDIYFAGDIRTNDEMFYLWVAVFAFYYMPARVAALELGWIGIAYAVVLSQRHEPDASTRWLILVGSLTMVSLMTSRLVAQIQRWADRSLAREAELRETEQRFRSTFDDAAVGMAMVGLDGRWLRVNAALAQLTGYSPEALVGRGFKELSHEDDLPRDLVALADLVEGRRSVYRAEKRYRRADGQLVWVALTVSCVTDDAGRPVHLISQMQDITDRKRAERQLAERALQDPLTGLPNRLLFLDRVQMALRRLGRQPAPVGVFFIDLDRFKLVNDSLGHTIGDRMLIEVAARMRQALRPADTVSRFGGDEFTV